MHAKITIECDAVLQEDIEGELVDVLCALTEPHEAHYDGREWCWDGNMFWREYR